MKTTNKNEVQGKRSLTKGIIAIACACALALVGVFAYLTATDQVKNIFGFADKLDIEVVEPNWDPDNAQNLLPTQTVTKDPALHNPNKVDVYVFADVVIPQKDIVTANADGTLNESAVVDLFSYKLNDGWTLKDTIAGDDGTVTYRYAYNEVISAGETSGSIFDEVAIVNYVNEQFNTEELAQQIVINGYGAQAVGFANADDAYAAQFGENEKTFTADITVNDDSITAASEYEVKRVETLTVASASTASIDDQVIFEDVALVEDAKYAIVPAGENVDNAIAEFTADEAIMGAASSIEGIVLGEDNRIAFAVYSADDQSLSFYKRTNIPAAGERFEGKTVTEVYTEFEDSSYSYTAKCPWSNRTNILTASIVDAGITPLSTAYWFNDCGLLSSISGLEKLNTSKLTNITSMFCNCSMLKSVTGLEDWSTSNLVRAGGAFQNCSRLVSLDLTNWDISALTVSVSMFNGCTSLTTIIAGSDWAAIQTSSGMFYGCSKLTGGNGTAYSSTHTDATYAHIDGLNGQPGYFTAK